MGEMGVQYARWRYCGVGDDDHGFVGPAPDWRIEGEGRTRLRKAGGESEVIVPLLLVSICKSEMRLLLTWYRIVCPAPGILWAGQK